MIVNIIIIIIIIIITIINNNFNTDVAIIVIVIVTVVCLWLAVCLLQNSPLFLHIVLDRLHLGDQILHNRVADLEALCFAHFSPCHEVLLAILGHLPALHELLKRSIVHLVHSRSVLDEEQCGWKGARRIVLCRCHNRVIHKHRLRRLHQRANFGAQLHATLLAAHEVVADDRVIE